MRPSNDHEVAIADIIDGFSLEGRLQLSVIPEVAAALAAASPIAAEWVFRPAHRR